MMPEKIDYRILQTPQGLDTIIIKSGEREMPLHSKKSPEREADAFRGRFDPARYDALIVLGVGLGYHLVPLRELIGDYARVILVDVLAGIREAIGRNPLTSFLLMSNAVSLISGKSTEEVERAVSELIDMDSIRGISVVEHPASMRLFGGYYGAVRKSIEKIINIKAGNKATRRAFGARYVRNILQNFSLLDGAFPVRDLFGAFDGHPAVMAASGPSLETNADMLKRYQNRFFIIAADSALPSLASRGISPDIIVSIDPQPYVLEHFLGCDTGGAITVSSISSHPSVLKRVKGHVFLNSHPLSQLADEIYGGSIGSVDSATGSVAGDAVSLCMKCGFSAVGITGLDFSFMDFSIYARGTAYHRRYSLFSQDRFATVEGQNMRYIMKSSGGLKQDGKFTRKSFLHYRQALEDFIRERAPRQLHMLNDRGMPVAGIGTMNMEEFVSRNCPAPIDKKRILGALKARSQALAAGPALEALERVHKDEFFNDLLDASLGPGAGAAKKERYLNMAGSLRR